MGLDIVATSRNGLRYRFCAGSYGWYNDWREQLAKMVDYPPVTKSGEEYNRHSHSMGCWESDGGPFYELINFSDCEGTINANNSAKLYQDFVVYESYARDMDSYFYEKYSNFKMAFKLASKSGKVEFH